MSYYFSKKTFAPFDDVLRKVTDGLKKEGFEIRAEAGPAGTPDSAPDIGVQRYKILGGGRPSVDDDAATAEADSGEELSCYVIAQGFPGGTVKVAAVDPEHTTQAVDDSLSTIAAKQVRTKLYHVIASI